MLPMRPMDIGSLKMIAVALTLTVANACIKSEVPSQAAPDKGASGSDNGEGTNNGSDMAAALVGSWST